MPELKCSNMAEFTVAEVRAIGGCPCTDEKQFPELYPEARRCEFEL